MHSPLQSLIKYLRGVDKRQLVFVRLCLLCSESFRPICRRRASRQLLWLFQEPNLETRPGAGILAVETRRAIHSDGENNSFLVLLDHFSLSSKHQNLVLTFHPASTTYLHCNSTTFALVFAFRGARDWTPHMRDVLSLGHLESLSTLITSSHLWK